MNRVVYLERKTFVKYDDQHVLAYLNEEIVPDYVPDVFDGEQAPEPVSAFSYEGPMTDGGTLIEASGVDRDSLINGIIRSRYSQSEEDALKTHQIILLHDPDSEKAEEYALEWAAFNAHREFAKATVDAWMAD